MTNLPIKYYCVITFVVDVVMVLQRLKIDEVVLLVKFYCCLVIVRYMEIYRKAVLERLLNQIYGVVKHLGADPQLATLINHPNRHNIACLPPTEHTPCPTEKSLLNPLQPALPLPPLPVYGLQYVLILITFLLYTRHAASNQNKVLPIAVLDLVEASYRYDILLVNSVVELLRVIYWKPLLMELTHILLVLLIENLILDIVVSESVVADDV